MEVTPFVGVWIETYYALNNTHKLPVTPFVGVWIETARPRPLRNLTPVTPFVGVWIETPEVIVSLVPVTSHTLRGCVD